DLLFPRPAADVFHGDAECRVDVRHLDRAQLDPVAEPLLERGLHGELGRGGERVAVGREHELHEPAPERGPVDALAGAREEDLPDQVAEVLVVGALAGASASAESEREVDVHGQVPITRGCVPLTMGGPCGAWSAARQRPTLVWRITGERFTLTRTAGTSHC